MKPKRIISLLLAICLVAGLMPTVAFATGSNKAIMLGTEHLQGGQADNIYFGNYAQTDSTGNTKEPVKWRVLKNADGQLFLLSDQNLDVFQYHTESESVTWETSTMRSWLNGYSASHNTGGDSGTDYTSDNFIDTAFSDGEQGAIVDTTVVNDDNPDYKTEGGENTNDKIFLLSIAEAQNSSYFTDDSSRIATNTAYVAGGGKLSSYMNGVGAADYWWLRSPGYDDSDAADVDRNGGVFSGGIDVYNVSDAVRPAFNLNLNSVLFTSAAVGGKSASGMDSGLTAVGDYDGNEWKLTLLDETREFAVTEQTVSGISGGTVTLNYTGTTTGTNEYISVILADENGAQYYGRVAQPTDTDGTVEITIPSGLADGTYTLYVFSEQYNGGEQDDTKLTDYASAFETVALTVSSDTTAPTLSSGSATRDSETAATVKFTSDEAGKYYYAVVESGDTAPTIDTTGTGTACDTTEQTISLNNLSGAGAKDIYIVAKDAAGNVSQQLKITIPAYIAPSYGISASPAALDFGSKTAGYTEAPAAQTVTLTNTGNQNVTVDLPTSTNYIITAGEGFTNDTATLAPNGTADFTVQPNTGLAVGSHSETLNISGSDGTSASVKLSFTVAFATGSDKAIMLGASNISGYDSTNGYDYIYYGEWDNSPIKWRVLDEQTNTQNEGLFLLSDVLLGTGTYGDVYFDNSGSGSNVWQNSTAQTWCKNFYSNNFSSKEQNAVLATTKSDSAYTSTYLGYEYGVSSLSGDKVFFLSAEEAENSAYGFTDDNARIANYGNSAGRWWLRSPDVDFTYIASLVTNYGFVFYSGVLNDWAARPAFNLDLNSVLFISAAAGGKSSAVDGNLRKVATYDGNEWKLTLLDEARNSFEISNATITDTITFSYSGAATGTNEYISAVVVDNGAITHYGRILQPRSTSGTASFTIPDGVTLSDTVKLYVFNEQYNSDKMTDYASQLKEISSSTDDTTDPTLSNGSATRDSETTATVKFTSSEAGSYYYEVVNSGENQPTIDTDGTGTTCGTTEQTISLTNLSDTSAKDIYIVVKDAAGNVSQPLKIQIPAYTSTTFTVTVNVDPSDGGTASANYTTAAPNTEITLTATPSTGYHFKEWQVTEGTASIGDDNKFTMPAENVTVKAVFEAHSFTQENTDSEYLASSATCTQAATYYYSCSCGAKDTNNTFTSGEALGHTLGADWKYNDSNHWKECEDCGAKVDEAAHTFAWVTDKPATAAEAGSRHEQCTVCGYRKAAESIPPLAPEPDRGTDEHPEIGDAIADGTWGKTESAPADGETNTEKTVPATGDSSQPVLWIGLLAASGLGIAALLVLRRRKRQ